MTPVTLPAETVEKIREALCFYADCKHVTRFDIGDRTNSFLEKCRIGASHQQGEIKSIEGGMKAKEALALLPTPEPAGRDATCKDRLQVQPSAEVIDKADKLADYVARDSGEEATLLWNQYRRARTGMSATG